MATFVLNWSRIFCCFGVNCSDEPPTELLVLVVLTDGSEIAGALCEKLSLAGEIGE